MRIIAAIPAAGLLAGAAFGLLAPDRATLGWALTCAASVAALWAWAVSRPAVLVAAVSAAFAGGGAVLAGAAWEDAWRPPLRVAFEELARAQRREAVAVSVVSGFSRTARTNPSRAPPLDDQAFAIVTGRLRSDAAPSSAGVSLSLDIDGLEELAPSPSTTAFCAECRSGQPLGGAIVTVVGSLAADQIGAWRAGRHVRFPVQLHRAARYLDPGVPDFERALARRGTSLVGTVKSSALVEVLERGSFAAESFGAVRAYARRAITISVGRWSGRSAAIVNAIVIGDRAGLDDEVERRLQEAGTYHVIAISGGNIAILAGVMLGAFRIAGALGPAAMLAAGLLLTAYAGLVGGGASVERATLMAVVYLGARALDHRTPPLNALAVVAGVLVAIDPLSVADPGFLLTCGATLAILLAAQGRRSGRPRLVRVALGMLVASVATEALLCPIGAVVFSRVTFAGVALNFFAIPLMAVAQLAGMTVVPAFMLSGRLAAAVGWIAHGAAASLVWSAELVRYAPLVAWRVAPPGMAVVCAYYVALIAALTLVVRRQRTGGAESLWSSRARRTALVVAGSAAVWILAQPWTLWTARGDGRLHVTFVDVGQGDSVFVRFPGGRTMVVDAGGLGGSSSFDIGDRVVAPVLRQAGVRRVDYLALTHGDPDHIGGAAALIGEFRPRTIFEGIAVPRSEPLARLRRLASGAGSVWTAVRRDNQFRIDDVDVRVLHPAEPDWERQKVRNDDSIVMELVWRDVAVLLTGDIGREVERDLPPLAPAKLRVLKIPHHGSLTSSSAEFVAAVHPAVVVASAGRSNTFGHPAPAVLKRYEDIGAEVYRTDRDGAVTIDTDGYSLDVRTFTGGVSHHEVTNYTKSPRDRTHTSRFASPSGTGAVDN